MATSIDIAFPDMFRVRQTLDGDQVTDIAGEVQSQLSALKLDQKIRPGQSVAITAGSRGIANIKVVLRSAVDFFKSIHAEPFIVPAMGSHGGGTVEGQLGILAGYGITEEYCGCPIRATMETVVVCNAGEGFPVHFDRFAYEADHVLVCGRVKPHTNFVGDIESGLMKMMLIGLGKHNGAKIYHRAIHDHSFGQIVRSVAREVSAKCRIVAGLAIVENGYDQTAKIEAVGVHELETREKELLKLSKQLMPKLPFYVADILMIDEIGKNISGTGMDTNIVGRKFGAHKAADHETPKIRHILIRGLTEATHGNATGLGLAEFCLGRVVRQRDAEITKINCLTGGHALGAMTPVNFETDFELLQAATSVIGLRPVEDARILWIQNTLELAEVECSMDYFDEAQQRDDLEIIETPRPLPWDQEGMLQDWR